MRRLAPVPDRQAAPRLRPRSPKFSLASSMSPGFGRRRAVRPALRAVLHRTARRRITHGANGALAMQPVRCGDRAGISGSFCECLATDRPHMRRRNTFVSAIQMLPLLFCVKQPATTTADFPRPTVCCTPTVKHMTKLRATRAIGAGILRRAACRVGGPRTDAAARRQAAGWRDAVQAAMRDLPHHQSVRSGPAGTVAVQGRRPAGRQGRRLPLFGRLRQGRFRLGRRQARRLAHQSAGDDSRAPSWPTGRPSRKPAPPSSPI